MSSIRQICICLLLIFNATTNGNKTQEELDVFLRTVYEQNATSTCRLQNDAEWLYATNITDTNSKNLVQVTLETGRVEKHFFETVFKTLKPEDYKKTDIQRQIHFLKIIGHAALNDVDLKNLTDIVNKMTDIYSTAKICPFNDQQCTKPNLTLEPDIEEIITKSTTTQEELEYVWTAWRKASGMKMKHDYAKYVELSNKAAVANGFKNKAEMWKADYETENFVEEMDKLWAKVQPLYNKLHKFVRIKLIAKYGKDKLGTDGLIPANLLGNMWAQSWNNLGNIMKPYPKESPVDLTAALKAQKYTVKKLFETSDEFYTSLGLPTNAMSFDETKGAVITKPTDREVLCHASAWDFCDGHTYRIKMCTEVDAEDFITIHHEMGHIQYFIQYKNQPIAFRAGANPGFHEAVGDTIALSVTTPTHLQAINLLTNYTETKEASINALMDMALERLAFLPFGLLIDKWRWDIFSGTVPEGKWNSHWWKLREQYQKVKAPVARSDESDFDPGAKYHVAGDSQYINYFVAHILEFQLYRGLCVAAGQYDPAKADKKPLHKCDFYNSKEAGAKLSAGLSMGISKPWPEALHAMTGERTLDASAILEYFKPLEKYLDEVLPSSACTTTSTIFVVISVCIYHLFS